MSEPYEDGRCVILSGIPEKHVGEILALLGSQGIEGDWRKGDGAILVDSRDERVARDLVEDLELDPDETDDEPDTTETVIWSGRGANALLAVVVACGAVFWSTHLSGEPVGR